MELKVGDKVEVMCPGLAQLRALMGPDEPPNNVGIIAEDWEDEDAYLINFPIGDDDPEEHSQAAPYPKDMVRLWVDQEV